MCSSSLLFDAAGKCGFRVIVRDCFSDAVVIVAFHICWQHNVWHQLLARVAQCQTICRIVLISVFLFNLGSFLSNIIRKQRFFILSRLSGVLSGVLAFHSSNM